MFLLYTVPRSLLPVFVSRYHPQRLVHNLLHLCFKSRILFHHLDPILKIQLSEFQLFRIIIGNFSICHFYAESIILALIVRKYTKFDPGKEAIQALAKGAASDPSLLQDLTSGMDEETARLQFVLEELAHLHDQVLGSLELNRQPTEMSEWLTRALLPWQQAAAEKHLSWQVDIPPDLPILTIDALRLGQVVGNLASNAIKYTPPGGAVTVSSGREGHELWIRFNDNGPGIAPYEQEKIFQPYYRGDQGRRIKHGMGLGLSIANDLVAAHEGHIEIESQPGEGSIFTVWLPI